MAETAETCEVIGKAAEDDVEEDSEKRVIATNIMQQPEPGEVPMFLKVLIYIPVVNMMLLFVFASPSMSGMMSSLEGLLLLSALIMSFLVGVPGSIDEAAFVVPRCQEGNLLSFKQSVLFGIVLLLCSILCFLICFCGLALADQSPAKQTWRGMRWALSAGIVQMIGGLAAFFVASLIALDCKFLYDGGDKALTLAETLLGGEEDYSQRRIKGAAIIILVLIVGTALPLVLGLAPMLHGVLNVAYNVQRPVGIDQQHQGPEVRRILQPHPHQNTSDGKVLPSLLPSQSRGNQQKSSFDAE